MTKDHLGKSEPRVSVARRVHRFLFHYFSKLRGISGGVVLMSWLSSGFVMAATGHGFIRVLGSFLLVMFVASYIFLAYFYPDDAA